MVFSAESTDHTNFLSSSPTDRLNEIISTHLNSKDINNFSQIINSTSENTTETVIDNTGREEHSSQSSNDENKINNDQDISSVQKKDDLRNSESENSKNNSPSKCSLQSSSATLVNSNLLTSNEKNLTLYKNYKMKVMRAVRQKKIFIIYGNYRSIRSALLNRGWLEKIPPGKYHNLIKLTEDDLLSRCKRGNDYETVLISKMLDPFPPYFIWQPKYQKCLYDYMSLYRNHIKKSRSHDFTTKDGLMTCIQNYHWHHIDGVTEIRVPKFHTLEIPYDLPYFLKMYRITYCLSLLRFLSEKWIENVNMYCENGEISDEIIQFAIDRIQEKILELNNEDIDDIENIKIQAVDDEKWKTFIENCDKIIMNKNKFKKNESKFDCIYMPQIERILTMAKIYWPTIHMDGYLNLWIMKPACQSRGCGIFIMKNYSSIIEKARKNPKLQYIVQKYIERPLLIYKTKFDIRQHILITITEDSMNIWFYKNCYLRFSSREFSLENLTESVHLTNNSVQKKYKNGKRSELLPVNNMWTSRQFCNYLKSIEKSTVWEEKIYPSMKSNIIAVVLASLEETDFRKNQFELYGCDFMLDENFDPILLEINSAPDMTPSTSVTAKLCPLVLHDVIKVVLDLKDNSEASTGNFELVYKIPIPRVGTQLNGLEISGKKIRLRPLKNCSSSNSVDIKDGQKSKKHIRKRKLNSSVVTENSRENRTNKVKKKKLTVEQSQKNPKDPIFSDKTKKISSAVDIIKRSVDVIKTLRLNSFDSKLTKRLINSIHSLHEKGIDFGRYSSFYDKTILPTDIRQALAIKFNSDSPNLSNKTTSNGHNVLKEFLNILYLKA